MLESHPHLPSFIQFFLSFPTVSLCLSILFNGFDGKTHIGIGNHSKINPSFEIKKINISSQIYIRAQKKVKNHNVKNKINPNHKINHLPSERAPKKELKRKRAQLPSKEE